MVQDDVIDVVAIKVNREVAEPVAVLREFVVAPMDSAVLAKPSLEGIALLIGYGCSLLSPESMIIGRHSIIIDTVLPIVRTVMICTNLGP